MFLACESYGYHPVWSPHELSHRHKWTSGSGSCLGPRVGNAGPRAGPLLVTSASSQRGLGPAWPCFGDSFAPGTRSGSLIANPGCCPLEPCCWLGHQNRWVCGHLSGHLSPRLCLACPCGLRSCSNPEATRGSGLWCRCSHLRFWNRIPTADSWALIS